MITGTDIQLVRHCLDTAIGAGADKVRATLTRSLMDLVATLDGKIDKITHSFDCDIELAIFAEGKYGSFSTNSLDKEHLDVFIRKAVDMVKILAEDPARKLPEPEHPAKTATTGDELGLYDASVTEISPEQRKDIALKAAIFNTPTGVDGCSIISEEGEYSDSTFEVLVMDTNGCCCKHVETTFDYGVELTIQDKKGNRYSGYWWDSQSEFKNLDYASCGPKALEAAIAQIGQKAASSGVYNMVVDRNVASQFVKPILKALSGYDIQQGDTFLKDSLGKQVFPEGLTIVDEPHRKGEIGSRLFDTEGVATSERTIVEKGVVKQYFINTFMSGKLGMEPTSSAAVRPHVHGWPKEGLTKDDILKICSKGILVTGFNGGNYSSTTGDFSFGIEGQLFRHGKIVHPVSEMLVTGNILTLWNNLIACGSDIRTCMSKLIPTLAFSNVDFSG